MSRFIREPYKPAIPYEPWPRCRWCWSIVEPATYWCAEPACQRACAAERLELEAFVAQYPELEDRLAAILRGEFEPARRAERPVAAPALRAPTPQRVLVPDEVFAELESASERGEEHLHERIRARGVELIRAEAFL